MQQRGPWKIKESSTAYKNSRIEVVEHQVIRPDGKEDIFALVRLLSGACILPIDNEGNVYLNKEYRFALENYSIEMPGGAIDGEELPLTAAKRELKEELGIEAEEWVPLGNFEPGTSIIKATAHLFVAKKLAFSEPHQDSTEQIQMVKVPFNEAVRMVMDGEIKHGASCLLILKAKELFKDKVTYN